jgi:tRNA-specific 2-thiouridylase
VNEGQPKFMTRGRKTIAVALSGGMDSAYAALVLKEEGWNVIGVHLILPLSKRERAKRARLIDSIAKRLDIPSHFLDVKDLFHKTVIEYFINAYSLGMTPNPCVVCNSLIKLQQMITWIEQNRIDYLATGHYARVRKGSRGNQMELLKGKDKKKDQSYFLHRLNQHQLSRTMFPLGDMTKSELYLKAEEMGLTDSVHHESQEICFIPDNDYRSFFTRQVGEKTLSSGNIVDCEGKVLGVHSGTHAYTIGQRHGLGIASREPFYVYQIRPETNEVAAGPRKTLFSKELTADDFRWIGDPPAKRRLKVEGQIRYRHQAASGTLTVLAPDLIHFEFDQPQWAITPGQAFVCYEEGERVLGGGWIRRPK